MAKRCKSNRRKSSANERTTWYKGTLCVSTPERARYKGTLCVSTQVDYGITGVCVGGVDVHTKEVRSDFGKAVNDRCICSGYRLI